MNLHRMIKVLIGLVILVVIGMFGVRGVQRHMNTLPETANLWQLERFVKHRYVFSFHSQGVATALTSDEHGKRTIDAIISGNLSVTNIASNHNITTILASIVVNGISIKIDQTTQGSYEQSIVRQVQSPFTFELTDNGTIKNVVFAADSGLEGRSMILALLSGFQVHFGPAGSKEWTAVEEDLNGLCQVRYQLTEENPPSVVLQKTKVKYNSPGHLGETTNEVRIISSDGKILWDLTNHIPKNIDVKDSIRIELGTRTLSSTENQIQFTFAESTRLSSQDVDAVKLHEAALKRSGLKTDLASTLDARKLSRDMQTKILGDASKESLLSSLNGPLTADAVQLPLELYRKIKAMLILEPTTARDFAAAIMNIRGSDPRFRDVTLALSEADTPEAQSALRDIIDSRKYDEEGSVYAIPMLGLIKHPDEASEALLKSLISSDNTTIGNSAILGLGIIGGTLQYPDEPRSKALYELLKTNLAEAADEDRKKVYLSSLGNLGNPEQLALAEPYIRGEQSDLRVYATSSLRFVPTQNAQDTLLSLLQGDKDVKVRGAAAEALSYRAASKTLINGLIEALKKETNAEVGVQIIRDIAGYAHLSEDAFATLKWAQENAPIDNARREAKSQLLGIKK